MRKDNLLSGFDNIPGDKNSESINHVMPATLTLRGCVKTKEMSQKEEVPAILADKVLWIHVAEV